MAMSKTDATHHTEALKQLTYLASALKAPRITEAAARLADHARDAGWTHEEYLAAVLGREVAARNASGAQLRICAAGFATRKPARVSSRRAGTSPAAGSPHRRADRRGRAQINQARAAIGSAAADQTPRMAGSPYCGISSCEAAAPECDAAAGVICGNGWLGVRVAGSRVLLWLPWSVVLMASSPVFVQLPPTLETKAAIDVPRPG